MRRQSKGNRQRVRRGGMGGGFTVLRRVPPRSQRDPPQAPTLRSEATFRLVCVRRAAGGGVRDAVIALGVARATIARWRQRNRPDDLTRLEARSRRPKRVRRGTWTAAQEQAVLALRRQYSRMGKDTLHYLLKARGIVHSASLIGRGSRGS